jgi:hypothetical protein
MKPANSARCYRHLKVISAWINKVRTLLKLLAEILSNIFLIINRCYEHLSQEEQLSVSHILTINSMKRSRTRWTRRGCKKWKHFTAQSQLNSMFLWHVFAAVYALVNMRSPQKIQNHQTTIRRSTTVHARIRTFQARRHQAQRYR